jgi:hypothetical protein
MKCRDESRAGAISISPPLPFVFAASVDTDYYNWLCLATAPQNQSMSITIYQTYITGFVSSPILLLEITAGIAAGIIVIWLLIIGLIRLDEWHLSSIRKHAATLRDPNSIVDTPSISRQDDVQKPAKVAAVDVLAIQSPAPSPFKRSAAVRKAAVASATKPSVEPGPSRVEKIKVPSGTQPKDKSGYSQNAVETGTPVNRTVLKEYIERQRKEGARELHFIKIKNDLNIISQKKSSKLYRILQDLVRDEIIVRKGSNYIIVG